MSYATEVFIYQQHHLVYVQTPTSARTYLPQYSKPLTLHKGVDNQIRFQFLGSNQKPVDCTGASITCRILNDVGNAILLQTTLNPVLPLNGIMTLDIGAADLADIDAQRAYYTLEIPNGTFNYPVFVDQNAGGRGIMNIVNSILPSFVPSVNISIPSGQKFPNLTANNSTTDPLMTANTYYSSVISTQDSPILTIQTTFDQYIGNVVVQGSFDVDANWYDISTTAYANASYTDGYVIEGYHPFVRLQFVSTTGNVSNILTR